MQALIAARIISRDSRSDARGAEIQLSPYPATGPENILDSRGISTRHL